MVLNNISKCHFERVQQRLVPLWKSATIKISDFKYIIDLRSKINDFETSQDPEFYGAKVSFSSIFVQPKICKIPLTIQFYSESAPDDIASSFKVIDDDLSLKQE